jgi:hypothetical protein
MIVVILWLLIFLSGLYLIFLVVSTTLEGFDGNIPTTKEKDLKDEITQYMTLANDTICVAYKEVLNQIIDKNLPEDQKSLSVSDQDPDIRQRVKAEAISEIAQLTMPMMPPFGKKIPLKPIEPGKVGSLVFSVETTGFLFPCPPPKDPLQVPNNIDQLILKTTDALFPKIIEMKNEIEKALSCPQKFTNYTPKMKYLTEGFEDANADPELAEQRIQVLQIKATALKKAINNPTFITFSSHIKTLKEIKAKAESGQGSTNCSA